MENKLTIFFNKRTGVIKELCSGEQTMDWFGDEAQDFELIYDFIIVEFDQYILENYMSMKVVDRELKAKQEHIPEKYQ